MNGANANPANVAGNVLTTTGITTDTVVLVTVTNANGCSDTASLTVLVPYVVTPGNITAPGDTNICPGEDQPEIASASLGTAAGASATATATYQWQYKVGAAAWQNIAGQTSSVLGAGTFNIVETTSFRRLTQAQANGVFCDATPSATEVTITVDQDRNLNIATSDADNRICASDAITFTGQNFVAGDTFRWLLNGAPIGGETNSTYNAAAGVIPNGAEVTFEVTTPGGGCTYTASVTIDVASDPVATIDTNAPG